MDKSFTNKLTTYTIVLVAILVFVWELRYPLMQLDDAFISYRYAMNLVEGNGLVFNVGERVEGYTNLLWVLVVALGMKLGFAAPIVGHWLCVAAGALLLWATYLYAALLLPKPARLSAAFAPWLILSLNSFAHWTSSGLEQGFFSALVTLALCASLLKRFWVVALLCMLATATRPEGVLVALVLLNLPWICLLRRKAGWERREIMPLLAPAIGYGLFVALLTMFRWAYYGDIVPNTFYAKVGGLYFSWGVKYLQSFFLSGPLFLLIGTLATAVVVPRFRPGFALLIVFILYILWVRGDAFGDGRFMLPVVPIMVAGSLISAYYFFSRCRPVSIALLLAQFLAIFFSLYIEPPGMFDSFKFKLAFNSEFPFSARRVENHTHDIKGVDATMNDITLPRIRAASPAIHVIAAVGIGKLGYYGREFEVLDLVGLTNKVVARSKKSQQDVFVFPGHQKTDSDYILDRKPDLIFIPKKDSPTLVLPAMRDLWNNPRLESEYHWIDELGVYRRNF